MSTGLELALSRIGPADPQAYEEAARALDAKTKPRGSLGRLEEVAQRIAGIRHTPAPGRLRAAVVVAAGDHGVACEDVSAYPQVVLRIGYGPAGVPSPRRPLADVVDRTGLPAATE